MTYHHHDRTSEIMIQRTEKVDNILGVGCRLIGLEVDSVPKGADETHDCD